jgi:hypothetical protein
MRLLLKSSMVALLAMMLIVPAAAEPIATNFFYATWSWTDRPVQDQAVNRTWMWGPEAYSDAFLEQYSDSPNGARLVQYYDTSRMEISKPNEPHGPWYITNGLLVTELVSGQLQLGDDDFEQLEPAAINVVGDAIQNRPITYAHLQTLLDAPPAAEGAPLHYRAEVTTDGTLATYIDDERGPQGLTAGHYEPVTNHTVATPFWEFMTASGVTYGYSILFNDGAYTDGPLFENPYYATGFPITEAYWTLAPVNGELRDVLFQCFQRRCLTYTPANPDGWKVEAGNVGQHYYRWRYGEHTSPVIGTPAVEIVELWPGETFGKPGPVEEYITIRNNDAETVELGSWFLLDQHNDFRYVFDNISLAPGETLTIYSCGVGDGPGTIDIGYCDSRWDWGDFAQLFDPVGILASYRYVSSQ